MARKRSCTVGPSKTNNATVRRRRDNRLEVSGSPWCALTTAAFRKFVAGGLKICGEIDAEEKLARNTHEWVVEASGKYRDESVWTEVDSYPTRKLALKMRAQDARNNYVACRNFRVRKRGSRHIEKPQEGED